MKKLWINETEYIFFKENKKRLSDEIATRKRSFDFYSLGFNLPDPDPILYEKLIDKMNAEISKAILGQTLTTEIGSTGSYAASNTHMDVRKDIIDSDKKLV